MILYIRDTNGKFVPIPSLNGMSAYQLAVKNGYVGTEAEWIASLKGQKGDPGTLASGDAKDLTVTFTEAADRTTIETGSTLAVIFGKLKKWFTDLKAVAFTGSYADLTGTPTIPTKTSQLTNDSSLATTTNVTDAVNTHNSNTSAHGTQFAAKQDKLTAGTGIDITGNVISTTLDLSLYQLVTSLPTTNISTNKIYLVQSGTSGTNNIYTEYIYVNSAWEILGEYTSAVDLTPYYTKTEVNSLLAAKAGTAVATTSAAGLMSATDKTRSDYNYGSNAVTTLASLPITKRLIIATLSAATSLSLAAAMEIGQELYIRCVPSAAFTQPIPNSGSFVSMSGSSITTVSGTPFEISILCYAAGYYSIVVKTQD